MQQIELVKWKLGGRINTTDQYDLIEAGAKLIIERLKVQDEEAHIRIANSSSDKAAAVH